MSISIHPTHSCFDDALDFLANLLRDNPGLADAGTVHLVHGILLTPATSEPFAHAWVEYSGAVWQCGILNGKRICYGMDPTEFAEKLRPQDVTRYTPRQAWKENERSNTFGPWVERYQELCRKPAEAAP